MSDNQAICWNPVKLSLPKCEKEEDMSAISREDFDKYLYPLAYFVGAFLGDGHVKYLPPRSYQVGFVSMDQEILSKVLESACNTFNDLRKPWSKEEITKSNTKIYRMAFCSKTLTEIVISLTGFKTQLPDFIWGADKQTKLDLLAGLMDTDGSIIKQKNDKCRNGFFYVMRFTGTKFFVTQFPDLCRVIGIKITGFSEENHSNPKHAKRYLYSISLPSVIENGFKFYCKRKQARLEEAIDRANTRYINEVPSETTRLTA